MVLSALSVVALGEADANGGVGMDAGTAHNQAEGEGGVQVVLVALGFRDDPAGFQTRGIFLKEMAVVAAVILRKATSGNVVSRHGA